MGRTIAMVRKHNAREKTSILTHLGQIWMRDKKRIEILDLNPTKAIATWANKGRQSGLNFRVPRKWRAEADIVKSGLTHDITLVECPLVAGPMLHATARAADIVIVPCEPTKYGVWVIGPALKTCQDEGKQCYVMIHDVGNHGADNFEAVKAALEDQGAEVLNSHMSNRIDFAGEFLTDYAEPTRNPHENSHQEILNLKLEIEDILDNIV